MNNPDWDESDECTTRIGYIYKIDLGDGDLYVGSTYDMKKRQKSHRRAVKKKTTQLYKTARRKKTTIVLELLEKVNYKQREELLKKEQVHMDELKSNQNMIRAYNENGDKFVRWEYYKGPPFQPLIDCKLCGYPVHPRWMSNHRSSRSCKFIKALQDKILTLTNGE